MDVKKSETSVAVVMKDGENLVKNLDTLSSELEHGKLYAVVSALGMLRNIEMGYWNGKEYERHVQKEPCELLGMSGLITKGQQPAFHFHIYVGTQKGAVVGGHLLNAEVCNTLEMVLLKTPIEAKRVQEGKLRKLKIT